VEFLKLQTEALSGTNKDDYSRNVFIKRKHQRALFSWVKKQRELQPDKRKRRYKIIGD